MNDTLRLARFNDDNSVDDALTPLCRSIIDGEHRDVRPQRNDRATELRDEMLALANRVAKAEILSPS
jgi:hypothetical protein